LVCMAPIKHFYYYCDLSGFARCGHSFHPSFGGTTALRAVSSITPIVNMLPAAW
jgi:hypothetical protein